MRTIEQRERFRLATLKRMASPAVDPTPEEIAERCKEIQAGWTRVERATRWQVAHSVGNIMPPLERVTWRPPQIDVRELVA